MASKKDKIESMEELKWFTHWGNEAADKALKDAKSCDFSSLKDHIRTHHFAISHLNRISTKAQFKTGVYNIYKNAADDQDKLEEKLTKVFKALEENCSKK